CDDDGNQVSNRGRCGRGRAATTCAAATSTHCQAGRNQNASGNQLRSRYLTFGWQHTHSCLGGKVLRGPTMYFLVPARNGELPQWFEISDGNIPTRFPYTA